MEGSITLSIDKHIAVITFSHPVHNSMPGYLLSDLAAHIKRLAKIRMSM